MYLATNMGVDYDRKSFISDILSSTSTCFGGANFSKCILFFVLYTSSCVWVARPIAWRLLQDR